FCNLSFRNTPTDDSYIEIYFSDKLDISYLASIQSNLSKKYIKLNYDYLKFDKDGKLRAIEYHVWYKKVGGSDKTTETNKENGFIINTDLPPDTNMVLSSVKKKKFKNAESHWNLKND
ncbi:MAG: hypothetical protein ABI267_10955, partial [Ginsengibacter sp.]